MILAEEHYLPAEAWEAVSPRPASFRSTLSAGPSPRPLSE